MDVNALSEQVEFDSDWSSKLQPDELATLDEGVSRSLECPRFSCSNLLPTRLPHVRKPAAATKEWGEKSWSFCSITHFFFKCLYTRRNHEIGSARKTRPIEAAANEIRAMTRYGAYFFLLINIIKKKKKRKTWTSWLPHSWKKKKRWKAAKMQYRKYNLPDRIKCNEKKQAGCLLGTLYYIDVHVKTNTYCKIK